MGRSLLARTLRRRLGEWRWRWRRRRLRRNWRARLARVDAQIGRGLELAEREGLLPPPWMRRVWRAVMWLLVAIALWLLFVFVLAALAAVAADLATRP